MTRTIRPMAGVAPADIDSQRRLACALVENGLVGAAQDAAFIQVKNALELAGFVQTAVAEPTVVILASGAQRELVSDWLEPLESIPMVLRCTFYARFSGPRAGRTRLSLSMAKQVSEDISRLDETSAAHLYVASTLPPGLPQFEVHPEVAVLAGWERLGLLPGGSWAAHGPAEFGKLVNEHFAR